MREIARRSRCRDPLSSGSSSSFHLIFPADRCYLCRSVASPLCNNNCRILRAHLLSTTVVSYAIVGTHNRPTSACIQVVQGHYDDAFIGLHEGRQLLCYSSIAVVYYINIGKAHYDV